MRVRLICAGMVAALLGACAAPTDRFYALRELPRAARAGRPTVHVRLDVTLPSLIDRPEMVLDAPRGAVLVLEHERWAAPLSDQVADILARDIEHLRGDLIVADRRFDRADSPPISLKVDIVRLAAQRGQRATLEARWRAVDPGAKIDEFGSGELDAAVDGDDYEAVARAYSALLGELAEKLAADVRRQ
jgi:hypothetical protein